MYTPATAEAFATYGEIDTGRPVILPVGVPVSVLPQFGGLEVTLSSTAVQELTDAVLYLERYPRFAGEHLFQRRTTERFHFDIPMREVIRADITQPLTLTRAGEGRMYYRAASPCIASTKRSTTPLMSWPCSTRFPRPSSR